MSQDILGSWMTIAQVKEAGSGLSYPTISKIIHSDGLQTRRLDTKGRAIQVLMTPEAAQRLGIKALIDFRETGFELSSSRVVVNTPSGDYAVCTNMEYGYNDFASVLKSVLPETSTKNLEGLFDLNARKEGDSRKILGSRMISLLLEIKKGAFFGKTLFDYLSREAGVNIGEVAQDLNRVAEKQIKYLSPGLPYIPRESLPEVIRLVRASVYKDAETWPQQISFLPETPAQVTPAPKAEPKKAGIYLSVPGFRIRDIVRQDDGIELLVEEMGAPPSVSRKTDEAVPRDYKERFTIPELAEFMGVCGATVKRRLKEHSQEFDLRRREKGTGTAYEARVTKDNYHLLGISEEQARTFLDFSTASPNPERAEPPAEPVVPKPLPPSVVPRPVPTAPVSKPVSDSPSPPNIVIETAVEKPLEFSISEKPYRIFPSRKYTPKEVGAILRQVNSGAFSDNTVDNIFDALNFRGLMPGKDLYDYLNRVNGSSGMMILSSSGTRKKLEELGITAAALSSQELSPYVRTAPGLRDSYILKEDLPAMKAAAAGIAVAPPSPDVSREQSRVAALGRWERRLYEQRIMPQDHSLGKLIEAGVLVMDTEQLIERTYGTFEREMQGYVFFNFNRPKAKVAPDMPWPEFKDSFLSLLEKEGLAKDIVRACGGREDKWLYVLKQGTPNSAIEHAWGIK